MRCSRRRAAPSRPARDRERAARRAPSLDARVARVAGVDAEASPAPSRDGTPRRRTSRRLDAAPVEARLDAPVASAPRRASPSTRRASSTPRQQAAVLERQRLGDADDAVARRGTSSRARSSGRDSAARHRTAPSAGGRSGRRVSASSSAREGRRAVHRRQREEVDRAVERDERGRPPSPIAAYGADRCVPVLRFTSPRAPLAAVTLLRCFDGRSRDSASSASAPRSALDLLERAVLRLRHDGREEDDGADAEERVEPEGPRLRDRVGERQERVGDQEVETPVEHRADRHRRARASAAGRSRRSSARTRGRARSRSRRCRRAGRRARASRRCAAASSTGRRSRARPARR